MGERSREPTQRLGGGKEGEREGRGERAMEGKGREGGSQSWLGAETRDESVFARARVSGKLNLT